MDLCNKIKFGLILCPMFSLGQVFEKMPNFYIGVKPTGDTFHVNYPEYKHIKDTIYYSYPYD